MSISSVWAGRSYRPAAGRAVGRGDSPIAILWAISWGFSLCGGDCAEDLAEHLSGPLDQIERHVSQ
ncbi:MAG: hypothetical protein U5K69_18150 [Balneolaceae bacterium]|nr:hypothetical protein [Balneolaceae bacterium]